MKIIGTKLEIALLLGYVNEHFASRCPFGDGEDSDCDFDCKECFKRQVDIEIIDTKKAPQDGTLEKADN